jgi:hypothetical protein
MVFMRAVMTAVGKLPPEIKNLKTFKLTQLG